MQQSEENENKFGRNLDLNELQAFYVGKLYVEPGTVVPNHLSNLQV